MGTWWKTSQFKWWETEEENRVTNENILAPWESWWVLKDHVAGKKLPNPTREIGEENQTRESIDKKPTNSMKKYGKKTERL